MVRASIIIISVRIPLHLLHRMYILTSSLTRLLSSVQVDFYPPSLPIHSLGPHAFLAKLDIKSAFTICPVRKKDWSLLGCKWDGKYYVYPVLPFGARSSPHIFNSLADLIHWILEQKKCNPLHYLDDYFIAHLGRSVCQHFFQVAIDIFNELGVPLALDKLEGPTQVLKYLGIIIATILMETRLPEEKMGKIVQLLAEWKHKLVGTKHELQSLIGILRTLRSLKSRKTSLLQSEKICIKQ